MQPEQELHCCDAKILANAVAKLCDKCEAEFKRRSFPKVIQHPAWTRYFKKHPLVELGIRIVVDDTPPKTYFVRRTGRYGVER